jgi:hypothetical protein
VGRRDAEAENVADVGEGGRPGAALAGGDGLDGAADEAYDPAARPGRLSYLHVEIKQTIIAPGKKKATHHQQRKFKSQTITGSPANSYIQLCN